MIYLKRSCSHFSSAWLWFITLFAAITLPLTALYATELNNEDLVQTPDPEHDATQKLGRLFTTPIDREIIDAIRNNNGNLDQFDAFQPVSDEPTQNQSTITIPPDVYLKGVAIRSDGQHVIWSHNENTLQGSQLKGATVLQRKIWKDGSVPFQQNSQQFRLKPGQVWSTEKQQVKEKHLYQPKYEATILTNLITSEDEADTPSHQDIKEASDKEPSSTEENGASSIPLLKALKPLIPALPAIP